VDDDEIKRQIGRMMSDTRRERGLSQHEVAQRMGVKQGAISRWESGDRNMSVYRWFHYWSIVGTGQAELERFNSIARHFPDMG
jgi:DNA-binding XRE family transcriptional regulator